MSDDGYEDVHLRYRFPQFRTFARIASRALCLATLTLFSLPSSAEQAQAASAAGAHSTQIDTETAKRPLSQNEGIAGHSEPPAASECGTRTRSKSRADEPSPIGSLLQNANSDWKTRTFSCLSSVRQIHEAWSRSEALLIDVRRTEDYDKYKIPGSVNMAPFSIQSKRFLKSRSIVLVNEGRHLSQLEELCTRLKSKGFRKVAVMEGGLYAWHSARFPITGNRFELSNLNRISPAELLSSLHEREWKIINLDQALSGLDNFLPAAAVIEYRADKRDFISEVNRAKSNVDQETMSGFLVISGNGNNYRQIERLLQLTDAQNVFYLSGGVTGLKHYLNSHSSLISRFVKGFEEPHRCSG